MAGIPDYRPVPLSPASHFIACHLGQDETRDGPVQLDEQVGLARDLLVRLTPESKIYEILSKQYGQDAQPCQAIDKGWKLIREDLRRLQPNLPSALEAFRIQSLQDAMRAGNYAAVRALSYDIEQAHAARTQGMAKDEVTLTVEVLPPGSGSQAA